MSGEYDMTLRLVLLMDISGETEINIILNLSRPTGKHWGRVEFESTANYNRKYGMLKKQQLIFT